MKKCIWGLLVGLGVVTAAARAPAQQPSGGPATPAKPPLPPATQGPSAQEPPSAPTPEEAGALQGQVKAQEEQLGALGRRLGELDAKLAGQQRLIERQQQEVRSWQREADNARTRAEEERRRMAAAPKPWYQRIELKGYLQAQYERHQDSEDRLLPGGQLVNQDRFVLRRARLIAELQTRYSAFLLELDGNSVRGPSFGVQRAEASILWRGFDAPQSTPPLVQLTAGQFYVPFGRQLTESSRERPFMERTLASRGLFPSEVDLGVRLMGQLAFFRYAIAIMNGEPLGTRAGYPLQDPNGAKDFVGRLGVEASPSSVVKAGLGVSLLNGKGFFKGTDPTKATVTWRDQNENGTIETFELTPLAGTAGLAAQSFDHWAVGVDVGVELRTGLGLTQLSAEAMLASNLDRAQFVADPVTSGIDARELAYHVALLQDVTRHGLVGLRYDYYDPQADLFGLKNGQQVPFTQAVKTWSPLIGLRLPERTKLYVQYDIIRDYLARNTAGVPADRANNILTIRLQGEL